MWDYLLCVMLLENDVCWYDIHKIYRLYNIWNICCMCVCVYVFYAEFENIVHKATGNILSNIMGICIINWFDFIHYHN